MALKAGIVGLPNVGKSTIFNALTNAKAQAANFPFCTIEPNLGMITVPDERLNQLAALVNPKSIVPSTVEIVDIAGLVKGASKGEGLGNQFLSHVRNVDAIVHVVRCFDDPNVVHVDGSIDPVRDKEIIETELLLKDLESIDKRIEKIEKQAKTGEKDAKAAYAILLAYKNHLEAGKPARTVDLDDKQKDIVSDLFLLSSKPVLYLCNVDEESVIAGNEYVDSLKKAVAGEDAELLLISAAIESEIAQMDEPSERDEFLAMAGLKEPGLIRLIHSTYALLNLITYFTAGPKEVRAWTIRRGMTASQAAGVIHSDFEKGFIRAEVIAFNDYINLGSEQVVKEAGKMRVEGKNYVVKDADVMHFRFNV